MAKNFRLFNIIHLAQVLAMACFAIVSVVVVQMQLIEPVTSSLDRLLQLIAVLISVVMLFVGFRLFKSRIMKIREKTVDGPGRLANYRSACIIWWALIEGPGLLSFTCFMLTGNYAFFALGIFHLMILIMFTPKRDNIILLLDLSNKDLQIIEG